MAKVEIIPEAPEKRDPPVELDGPRRGDADVTMKAVLEFSGIPSNTPGLIRSTVSFTIRQAGQQIAGGSERLVNRSTFERKVRLDRPGEITISWDVDSIVPRFPEPIDLSDKAELTARVLDSPPLVLAVESPRPGDMPMPQTGQSVALAAQVTEAPFVQRVEASLDRWTTVNALARNANNLIQWVGSVPLAGDAPRDYVAEFRCFDFFGRETSQTVPFRAVDFTPPWIEVSTPPATDGEPVMFAIAREDLPWRHVVVGRVGDTQSGLAEAKWFMSGMTDLQAVMPDTAGNFRFPIERGDYGLYTLIVWATDRQGKMVQLNRQFRIAEAG